MKVLGFEGFMGFSGGQGFIRWAAIRIRGVAGCMGLSGLLDKFGP